jgi:2-(1,2-epoxy-1,2-dihydrophenyl)acetyl-CoA isomerase
MSEKLLYAVTQGVGAITLNRPQVLNALDDEMIVRLRAVCEQARGDSAVRAIVLRGNGPAFLAGGDVAMFKRNLPRLPDMVGHLAGELHHAILALRGAPKPVIASVHGAVAGARISLLAASDLALAATDTRFSLAYSRIGASPEGGTWFLPRLIGYRKAIELALLSDSFDAQSALASGLINRAVPAQDLMAETDRLARRLTDGPTIAYAETKALLNRSFETPLDAQLAQEARAFARCARTQDFAEGVTAFVDKREPRFKGE